ncbi:MAG: isoprenylcysteine carboxylmethyltransferase family protein [Chloroflexota bacterium]|jgi:protein-S-isoprenylcysteine O-methyltransferase Ste14|nr:isoprenylcysteine carboxylmethyltransferase family protein [Chloroflexota bacterium]MDH5242418.1 isoprenylcysteine carboxylmethyltransferase family protein [Chloroflexota bacterium]
MHSLPSLGPRGEGWVAIQFILLGSIAVAGWWGGPDWTGAVVTVSTLAGLLGIAAGAVMAFLGVRHLGDALTPLPHPRDQAELVQTGIYRRVRHPIYGGLIVAALGWGLLTASIPALLLTGVLAVFFRLKSAREETWLTDQFPAYGAYRERTRRFIPWLG